MMLEKKIYKYPSFPKQIHLSSISGIINFLGKQQNSKMAFKVKM